MAVGLKSSEVYRSGELPHQTDEDVVVPEKLGIRTVVNFLLPGEIERLGAELPQIGDTISI